MVIEVEVGVIVEREVMTDLSEENTGMIIDMKDPENAQEQEASLEADVADLEKEVEVEIEGVETEIVEVEVGVMTEEVGQETGEVVLEIGEVEVEKRDEDDTVGLEVESADLGVEIKGLEVEIKDQEVETNEVDLGMVTEIKTGRRMIKLKSQLWRSLKRNWQRKRNFFFSHLGHLLALLCIRHHLLINLAIYIRLMFMVKLHTRLISVQHIFCHSHFQFISIKWHPFQCPICWIISRSHQDIH